MHHAAAARISNEPIKLTKNIQVKLNEEEAGTSA